MSRVGQAIDLMTALVRWLNDKMKRPKEIEDEAKEAVSGSSLDDDITTINDGLRDD
jgi:hypothetical protein